MICTNMYNFYTLYIFLRYDIFVIGLTTSEKKIYDLLECLIHKNMPLFSLFEWCPFLSSVRRTRVEWGLEIKQA